MPTVIWLHGLGDSGAGWSHLRSELRIGGVDYIFPDAPVQPVSCNGGMSMPSWMDLDDIPVKLGLRDDAEGLEKSTAMIHAEIDKVVAKGTPAEQVLVGGFSQGGAMAVRGELAGARGVRHAGAGAELHRASPERRVVHVCRPGRGGGVHRVG